MNHLKRLSSYNITTVFIVPNLFPPGKHVRTISLNAHYIVVFKNPRDSLGINTLVRQAFPNTVNYIMESFKDAMEKPYSYILIDLHAITPESCRLRTMIFPREQQIAYVKRI